MTTMNLFPTSTQQLPAKLAELIRKEILGEEINTVKRKQIRTRTITAHDTFTACIGDSSYTVAANVDHAGINTMFTRGKCAYLAYRLHTLTSLPFAVWTDTATEQWTGHVAVALPNGEYLDIEGVNTNKGILNRYNTLALNDSPTLYTDTASMSTILKGDIAKHYKALGVLEKELIDYLAHQLLEES